MNSLAPGLVSAEMPLTFELCFQDPILAKKNRQQILQEDRQARTVSMAVSEATLDEQLYLLYWVPFKQ